MTVDKPGGEISRYTGKVDAKCLPDDGLRGPGCVDFEAGSAGYGTYGKAYGLVRAETVLKPGHLGVAVGPAVCSLGEKAHG